MGTEKYQKELFEFESPKKASARFGGIFPRTDFAVTLTPEKMVFAAIGAIMLMVIFFALGVEKGRLSAYAKLASARAITKSLPDAPQISAKLIPAPIVVTKSAAATNITSNTNTPAAKALPRAVFDKTKPYMVVAGAFLRKDLALKEVGKLKASGLDAFAYYGEPYYLACVGSFQNKESAQKILNKVKRMHKDAYVRLR